MAAITTRQTAGIGATVAGVPLTNAQLDQNFININTDLSNAVYLSTAQTITGIKTFSNGLITGSTSYPSYSASIDFGSDVGGTWRKIITVSSPNVQYSTIGFKIEVTDPQANHATTSSPDNIITHVYWVACVRTNDTVLDTPDSCYVRGPGSLIRAVKTSTGNYEIQVQCLTQYRELTVDISVYAVNGAHTVTYSAGTTASTGTVQYNAAIGTYTDWFGNISATGTGYVGGLLTANSGIYRATGNGVAYWLQQDGTGRNHWYWNTSGGTSPTFSYPGEDASALTINVTGNGAGGAFFHRSASGVGKLAGDAITWTTTIYSDINTFTWKGNTVWHSGNDGVGSGLDADLLDGQSGSYYTTAGNLTGTIPSSVLGASSLYLGTTAVALNRASAAGHTLNGVSIDGNAGTVTNGVYTNSTNTYTGSNIFRQSIVLQQAASQDGIVIQGRAGGNGNFNITLVPAALTLNRTITFPDIAGNVLVDGGSYTNPSWITSLSETKVLPSQTGNSGKYLTTNGTSSSWATVTLPSGQTSGSATAGYLQYNGTTKTAGQLDGGTTDPTNTTRLNYDGNFYATNIFGSIRTTDVVIRGGGAATEGGQIVLGYGNNTTTTITGQANSTWNIDVASGTANNDFRIFRQNAAGSTLVALQITESTGAIAVTGDLTVSGVFKGDMAVSVISTNTTAVTATAYILTASLTLTLPASPTVGDWVRVSNRSGTITSVIARNGSNIMSLAEDMTIDTLNATLTLVYASASLGWTLI